MDTLEKVEVLRAKANLTYEEAKNVLNEANGDILDAMVILERQGRIGKPAATVPSDEEKNLNVEKWVPANEEASAPSDEEMVPACDADTSSDQEVLPTADDADTSSDQEVLPTANDADSSSDQEVLPTANDADTSSDQEVLRTATATGTSSDEVMISPTETGTSLDEAKVSADEAEIPASSDQDNTPAAEEAPSSEPAAAGIEENTSSITVSETVETEKNHYSGKKVRKTMKKIWNVLKNNSFHITRKGSSLLTLPVWAFVLILLFTWKWMIPVMIISLFFQVRYSFDGKDNFSAANDFMDRVGNIAADAASEFKRNNE